MAEIWASIPDWAEKQHYKGRKSIPWIKLHKDLLTSYRFQCLPLASKALAPQLWLLASENNGRVRVDIEYLNFRLGWLDADLKIGLKGLIEKEYLKYDSNALASCKQSASPEEDEESDEESEKEAKASSSTDVDQAISEYRLMAEKSGLPKPRGTPRQKKQVAARLREGGLEDWRIALAKIRGSPFLQGQSGREGWPGATLDWMSKLSNYEKILEGNYDKHNNSATDRRSGAVDFVQRHNVPEENGDGSGGESVHNLRLLEGGR